MSALSAYVVPSGRFIWTGVRAVKVPPGHTGITCGLCQYMVMVPTRYGPSAIERLRRQHLGTVHLTDLLAGRAMLDVDLAALPWPDRS